MPQETTPFENQQLRGFSIRNLAWTVASTVTIVVSVMGTYFQTKADNEHAYNLLREEIKDVKNDQAMQVRVNDLRIKVLEDHVNILDQKIDQLRNDKKK